MTLGSCFHTGVAHNYRQKVESREDLPVEEVLDAFDTHFNLAKEDTDWGEEKPEDTKDRGIGALKLYHQIVAPMTQPAEVEQAFSMSFQSVDWTFSGIIDVFDQHNIVIETKTTSRKPSQPKNDHKLQTYAYATAQKKKANSTISARIDYAVAVAKPDIVSYDFPVNDTDQEFFLNLLSRVARAIELEIWIPARSGILCSRKWCGYWNECEKLIGGTVRR